MYWRLYRDFWQGERWLFYDGHQENLKYCLNAKEAERWYEEHRKEMVTVKIKRPPDMEVPIQLPLWTTKLLKKDIDKEFLTFITKGNVSIKSEFVLSKFMDDYYLWLDWLFYRREKEEGDELKSTRNMLALCMMKDIILWIFRITPLRIPNWRNKKDLNKAQYIDWDIWEDFAIEYEVWGEKYKTNLFWVYKPKLFDAMLADTGKKFDWFCLQRWQLDVWLRSWWVTYIIWPRSWWKSLYTTWDSAAYLLKEETDPDEKIQEFSVLYMGLSQKQNAPYMNYTQKMLNNLIDLPSFCNKMSDWTGVYIMDGNKQRKLEFVTTNQDDPTRSRRIRKFIWDEADYLDWDYVGSAMGTADALITLISTIDPQTQAGNFYQWWLNAYKEQREREPIEYIIHDIWTKYNMHLCKSRKDIEKKIKNWDFVRMRAEFMQRVPEVALHYTMDDVQFLDEDRKKTQVMRVLNARWYDYMLAEYYWEYSTNTLAFNIDWVQWQAPHQWDYYVLWYDEAETYDNPGLCCAIAKNWEYWVDQSIKLPQDPASRFAKFKEIVDNYKMRGWNVYCCIDASRWWAIARELSMLWIPVDMQVKWTGNVTYQPWLRHNVWKAWCIETIANTFFWAQNFHIDPKCYWDWWLIEEISHFKKWKVSYRWEKKIHDDQVSAMMLCLYYIWYRDQLWIKWVQALTWVRWQWQIAEDKWINQYQTPVDKKMEVLWTIKTNLF